MSNIYCSITYGGKRWKLLEAIEENGKKGCSKTWNEMSKKENELSTKIYLGECICKEKNVNHNSSSEIFNIIHLEGGA